MTEAVSNTSPLLYLYRIGILDWLPRLFDPVWLPVAVARELREGLSRGYKVPDPAKYEWLRVRQPYETPWEWLALDLGLGEIEAMALGLEHPGCVLLLDDALARRTAVAAGLTVWGTLRVLLEAKKQGLAAAIAPLVDRLADNGMWLSDTIRREVLEEAGEWPGD